MWFITLLNWRVAFNCHDFRPITSYIGLYQFIDSFSKGDQMLVMVYFQIYGLLDILKCIYVGSKSS